MLDFDLLCAYRLDVYDRDQRYQLAHRIREEINSWWTGQPIEDD